MKYNRSEFNQVFCLKNLVGQLVKLDKETCTRGGFHLRSKPSSMPKCYEIKISLFELQKLGVKCKSLAKSVHGFMKSIPDDIVF